VSEYLYEHYAYVRPHDSRLTTAGGYCLFSGMANYPIGPWIVALIIHRCWLPSAINTLQAANVVAFRLLPVTVTIKTLKKHGVCRPTLIVRPTSLQQGYQSNNGINISINCGGEWCHISIWRLVCCPAPGPMEELVIPLLFPRLSLNRCVAIECVASRPRHWLTAAP